MKLVALVFQADMENRFLRLPKVPCQEPQKNLSQVMHPGIHFIVINSTSAHVPPFVMPARKLRRKCMAPG